MDYHRAGALVVLLVALSTTAGPNAAFADDTSRPPNVLLITADDLNYDSLGVTGCPLENITPNIDRLAAGGLRFEHAHVTIAVCQPCRSVLMTGRYPHRNGARGFEPIDENVPTLGESLSAAGYQLAILGKETHLAPRRKFCWDTVVTSKQLGNGRAPQQYYRHARAFMDEAVAAGRPFFLMANSHDPHRPFAGSAQEAQRSERRGEQFPLPSRTFAAADVPVPGFLPDLPEVRQELAEYFASVHRCDLTVGAVLRALDESGAADNTVVMFLSDHGMPLPFAKTNCYRTSTRTPWMVRWPGRTTAGEVDDTHFISGIDLMPTVLDGLGIAAPEGMDGRSFLPLLAGETQSDRDDVYTVFHETSAKREYEMRSVQDRRFGYIFNAWSDGKTIFRNESQNGLTFKAMQRAAAANAAIEARVRLFQYRVPEELYDYEADPDALVNLASDRRYAAELQRLRARMLEYMRTSDDPLLRRFAQVGAAVDGP